MADFKSSFMGGYNKKAVDAYIDELENKNKELESNAKLNNQRLAKANKILKEYKNLKDEYEKLTSENNALKDKIENLEASLDKSTKQNNDHIANIGKIFYSAYESGSEITQRAKDGTNKFLAEIGKSSDNARAEIEKAIGAYSLINTDIKALLESITNNLSAVSKNTDRLIEKARGVASSMKNIDVLKAENEKNSENVIKKYDEFFKEYESKKTNEAASEPTYKEAVIKTVSEDVVDEPKEDVAVEKILEQKESEPKDIEIGFVNDTPIQEVKQVPTPRQPIQEQVQPTEQKQPEPRRAVDVIRQQMGAQRPVTPKEAPNTKKADENTPMGQSRAVMLKEVLKKFQNSEIEE